MSFDPNSASAPDSGIFGLPYKETAAALVYVPVPWEATVSYGGGTAAAPSAILAASRQVDLFDYDVEKPYEAGLFMRPESAEIKAWNRQARAAAQKIIAAGGAAQTKPAKAAIKTVNSLGARLNDFVYSQTKEILASGKIPSIVGGDHSAPYGAILAAGEKIPSFGVLHFDAHHDMRQAYEGFRWSHASILRNVLDAVPAVSSLVQVGIRDFCEEEHAYAQAQGRRVKVFYDEELAQRRFRGETWDVVAQDIVSGLPELVWITFDIDGLCPWLCPHTGTPVPGGLDFGQVNHVFRRLAQSGRRIIGFDLVEISPAPKGRGEWDANVGARLLWKLSAWTLLSHKLARWRN